ncbi:copper resistance protein [Salmonella enterica subsp. enterica serovar Napoli]|nr:copper resistance protein [Salmonella enterica subsp. enterica serovar Napoli]ECY4609912.1 copper resistance protein [Salmonella enterica subsp. enterica serovar Typhimurium]MLQ56531.1 copper resistance protein [Salmonella enterica subsp. enterica serovar Napoli]
MINDGHYFHRTGGRPTDGSNETLTDINQWINSYYNVHRPHSNNGGLLP